MCSQFAFETFYVAGVDEGHEKTASGGRKNCADNGRTWRENDFVLDPTQSTTFESEPSADVEQLTVHRLPGEPLGMECDVVDDVTEFLRRSRCAGKASGGWKPGEPAGMECDVIDDVTEFLRGPRVVVMRVHGEPPGGHGV